MKSNVFIARQPILDANLKVVAYELLFRRENCITYDAEDGDQATRDVISNSLLLFGLGSLTGYKRAFINFTENLLKSEVAACIPKDLVTIEILENIYPSAEISEICINLKKNGYQLALDDFVFHSNYYSILPFIDIIKIDFLKTMGSDRQAMTEIASNFQISLLAEKVETMKDFEEAKSYGYRYFQGYFFSKPEILSRKDIPVFNTHFINIIQEVSSSNFDYSKLELIISRDVSCSYKLLKFINTSAFGFSGTIKSIKQALVLLGQTELARWLAILSLREFCCHKPPELVKLSIVRARFGELLTLKSEFKNRSSDVFLLGMFSLIDALTARPLDEILLELPIAQDVKDVLLGQRETGPLSHIYDVILAYEQGKWPLLLDSLSSLNIAENDVFDSYFSAIKWTDALGS